MSVAGPEWKYILQYMFMGGSGLIHRWVRDGCDMEPAELAGRPDGDFAAGGAWTGPSERQKSMTIWRGCGILKKMFPGRRLFHERLSVL